MKEYKVIHAHVYEPHRSLFKSSKNDKSQYQIVECDNYQNCDLFKRKECCWIGSIGWNKCEYGKYSKNIGPTRRARKYYDWITKIKDKYKEVLDNLSPASNVIATVGDLIYIPYSHVSMNDNVPLIKGCFLRKEDFTLENIVKICIFKPQAMFGGEIKSYQNKQVPKFVKHLFEKFPKLYECLCNKLPNIKEISLTNIGREALLYTLTPNMGIFKDCHSSTWIWDGEYLTSKNSRASFMLINKFDEIKVKPQDDSIVKITDDKQVNNETRFYKS